MTNAQILHQSEWQTQQQNKKVNHTPYINQYKAGEGKYRTPMSWSSPPILAWLLGSHLYT